MDAEVSSPGSPSNDSRLGGCSDPSSNDNSRTSPDDKTIEDSNDSSTDKTEYETESSPDIYDNSSSILKIGHEKNHDENGYDLTITQDSCDGADSGVEVVRALSSNGSNSERNTPAQSCGSSLVSCYSEPDVDRGSDCGSDSSNRSHVKGSCEKSRCVGLGYNGLKTERSRTGTRRSNEYDAQRTSESCSETSSTYEAQSSSHSNRSSEFNRTVTNRLSDVRKTDATKATGLRRADSSASKHALVRSQSSARNSAAKANNNNDGSGVKTLPRNRSVKPDARSKIKPDNDDGRWPSSAQKNQTRPRCPSVVDSSRSKGSSSNTMSSSTISANSMSSSYGSTNAKTTEVKSNALEKYGTLPRRPKKKSSEHLEVPAVVAVLPRSNSVSREPSLNRAATLRRQQSKEKESCVLMNGKSLPPYPSRTKRSSTNKIVIYHEVNVQTTLTSEDVSKALAGIPIPDRSVVPVEKANKAVQSEGKDRFKKLEEIYHKLAEELERGKKENERLTLEKRQANIRICKMLGYPESKSDEIATNGLNELERHLQTVGLAIIKQQEELTELRHYKTIANRDLEKSFAAQKNLLQQQQEIEAEYVELNEFLQAEKSTLSESLYDMENEVKMMKKVVSDKEEKLEQQQAECKHLVRICEQRRQEILSLEAKLSGLEQRSRDVLLQQGAAVSGAAVALSGLGARLDSLVEQLAVSYNVSEKDLEDVIFHNEAYSHSQSEDNSPDFPPPQPSFGDVHASPKRGASFLHAILGAIRNATQSPFASGRKSPSVTQADQSSESLGLLDSEVEHCLVLETVFEEDSSMLPSYTESGGSSFRSDFSKDEASEETATLVPLADQKSTPNKLCHSDSLQNLSAAILARQQVERNERTVSPDSVIPIEVNSLVDQVIDVDNLVTKLLKVLRIVQLENDNCVDQLHNQRVELTEKLQQEQIYRQRTEDNFQRLQHELKEARSQLNARIMQLEDAKAMLSENWRSATTESQRQYATIDNALETLQSIQDVVVKYPPLAKLQQDLEECNFRTVSGDDLNANSATNGNIDNSVVKDVNKHNGTVLTTAI